MNFIHSIAKKIEFDIFFRLFDEFFSGFRAKFQKRVTSVAFQSNLRKQIRKLPKILKSVKIIQYYSILFIRVLSQETLSGGHRVALGRDAEDALRGLEVDLASAVPNSSEAIADPRRRALLVCRSAQLSRDPTNFRGLVLGCIEAKFCK